MHNRRGLLTPAAPAAATTSLIQCPIPELVLVDLHVGLILLARAEYLLAYLTCVAGGSPSGGHLEAVDTSAVDCRRWGENLERLRFRFDYMAPGRHDVPVVRGSARVGAVLDLILVVRVQMHRQGGYTVEALGTDLALILRG